MKKNYDLKHSHNENNNIKTDFQIDIKIEKKNSSINSSKYENADIILIDPIVENSHNFHKLKNKKLSKKVENNLMNPSIMIKKNTIKTSNEDLIKLNFEKLTEYLKCYLCKGIFRNPYTINECMDTFCKACILKYFANSQKNTNCPVCNVELGGRSIESLFFDNSINVIIQNLFPEFEEKDKQEKTDFYKFFRDNGQQLPDDNKESDKYMIFLIPSNTDESHLRLPPLEKNHIKIDKNSTIKNLKEFIVKKLDLKCSYEKIDVIYKNIQITKNEDSVNSVILKLGIIDNIMISYAMKNDFVTIKPEN